MRHDPDNFVKLRPALHQSDSESTINLLPIGSCPLNVVSARSLVDNDDGRRIEPVAFVKSPAPNQIVFKVAK